jgi:hypothetical protein
MSFIIGLAGTAGGNEPFAQFPGLIRAPPLARFLLFFFFFSSI